MFSRCLVLVVLSVLKKEAGDSKTRLLNEVLCLAGANKLVIHYKE